MWHLMALLFLLLLVSGCGKKVVKGNGVSDQYAQAGDRVKSYGQMDSLSTIMKDGLEDRERFQLGESTIMSDLSASDQHKADQRSGGVADRNSGHRKSLETSSSSTISRKAGHDGFLSNKDGSSDVVGDSLDPIGSGVGDGFNDRNEVASFGKRQEGNHPSQKGVTFSHNLHDVHFDFDSWRLGDQAQDILEANAEWLKAHPHEHVTIEGHCDERGTQSYNYVLGEKRAVMVQQYLTFLGVPLEQLHIASFGKDRPACRTMTADCFEQNRRAHFKASVDMVSQKPYAIAR